MIEKQADATEGGSSRLSPRRHSERSGSSFPTLYTSKNTIVEKPEHSANVNVTMLADASLFASPIDGRDVSTG